jgi:predicted nucleotidyltransferase
MCTEKQLKYISEKIVESYYEIYGSAIVSVLLYGSYSRNEQNDDSDIDIVAIVHGNRRDLQNKLRVVWDVSVDLGIENDVIISPTIIPYEEYEKYKSVLPYYLNIEKEGKKIG